MTILPFARKRFISTPYGELRQCTRCAHLGYGEDSWWPCDREFWPVMNGRIWFGRCRACAAELALQSKRKRVA